MGRKKVVDVAAQWFVQLDAAEQIGDKWSSFEQWLEKSPEHEEAFSNLEHDWLAARMLADLDSPPDDTTEVTSTSRSTPSLAIRVWAGISRWPKWSLMAGGVIVGALMVSYLSKNRVRETTTSDWREFKSAIGEHRRITFADGSTAELNTDTALQASVTAGHREARLDRGEVLFDVAHDREHPFVVHAGRNHVDAVGTRFTVLSRADDQLTTLVTEGKVELCMAEQQPRVINPQQLATTTPRGVEVVTLPPDEVERRMAWTRGELRFDHTPLEEVVDEFNRYNREQLRILDPAIRKLAVGGVYSATDPEAFANLNEHTHGVHFKVHAGSDGEPTIDLMGRKK